MKNALRWTLSLTFLALIAISCQQAADSPTGPSDPAVRSGDGNGTVTAQAGPSGPSPAGPNTGGAGPSTGPAGPGTGGSGGGGGGGGGGGLPGGGGGGGGGGATPTPTPEPTPPQTLHSFESMDVPQIANSGTGCPNGIPCIISTVDVTGVTGTVAHIRVGFQASFPEVEETSVLLYGPGYPGVDERAAFIISTGATGPGFGSSCNLNPRGVFTGSGATTWDDEAPLGLGASGTSSPYDGSYDGCCSPSLSGTMESTLNANPGDINGTYTLVIDRWTGGGITIESLQCWTLEIWTE